MTIPDRVDSHRIATLDDDQPVAADLQRCADVRQLEVVEKSKTGERYVLPQSPAPLRSAWRRWVPVRP